MNYQLVFSPSVTIKKVGATTYVHLFHASGELCCEFNRGRCLSVRYETTDKAVRKTSKLFDAAALTAEQAINNQETVTMINVRTAERLAEMRRSTVGVPGPIARVNALLKKAGRDERVIRGHGYLYLVGGVGLELGSIYAMNLEATEEDFEFLRAEVNDKFDHYADRIGDSWLRVKI